VFSVSALVAGVEVGRGSGRSKKDAEQVAAQAALEATEP
jgi:dsRNA-specific ribonuclease